MAPQKLSAATGVYCPKSPSSCRSRSRTRDLETRTVPGFIDRSAATSLAERPSTTTFQNACQVRSWNSPLIDSRARRRTSLKITSSSASESFGIHAVTLAARIQNFLQPHGRFSSSGSSRFSVPAVEVVHCFAAGNDHEPAAKGIARSILAKTAQVRGNRREDFLQHIDNILLRNSPSAAPGGDQWCIEPDKSFPRHGIRKAGFIEQAARGGTTAELVF